MGLFHCLFMLMRMIPLDFCLREMSFPRSLAFFNAFQVLPRAGADMSRRGGWPSSLEHGSSLHV